MFLTESLWTALAFGSVALFVIVAAFLTLIAGILWLVDKYF